MLFKHHNFKIGNRHRSLDINIDNDGLFSCVIPKDLGNKIGLDHVSDRTIKNQTLAGLVEAVRDLGSRFDEAVASAQKVILLRSVEPNGVGVDLNVGVYERKTLGKQVTFVSLDSCFPEHSHAMYPSEQFDVCLPWSKELEAEIFTALVRLTKLSESLTHATKQQKMTKSERLRRVTDFINLCVGKDLI
jgi:hypothetical protein